MLGGYQILDLRNIDLSRSTSEANITDVNVLKQLSNIADHIQKNYDFSKPLQNQLKPLLIRYRDKKVGEKHEVALYGNIEVINSYYKFRIIANNEGEQLIINVEFEEKTDEYSNKYWDIKTATVLLTSAKPIFEEITDKEGHKRFIEGDINLTEGVIPTKTYGKWSLSGSHLLIVLGLSVKENDVVPYTGTLTTISLPKWILDKIVPLSTDIVTFGYSNWLASDNSFQTGYALLRKDSVNNTLFITLEGFTADQDRNCRLQFDLLIDNESQE